MEFISSDKAPAAVGPYSQAVKAGGFLFCSGQIGLNPSDGRFVGDDVKSQTARALKNMEAVLKAAGLSLKNVVKTTIFLADMGDFAAVNKIYAEEFGDHRPARSTVQAAGLPLGALVEMECVAKLDLDGLRRDNPCE